MIFSYVFDYDRDATNNGITGFKKARYGHEVPEFRSFSGGIAILYSLLYVLVVISRD